MRSASLQEIKQEMGEMKSAELLKLLTRLARFKKDNKELLTYLLFEAQDEDAFVRSIQVDMDELFAEMNISHLYYAKKTLRKMIRLINKYSRYSGQKETDLRLRLYFCSKLHESGIPFRRNAVTHNIYISQVKKIRAILPELHEDIRYDYREQVDEMTRD